MMLYAVKQYSAHCNNTHILELYRPISVGFFSSSFASLVNNNYIEMLKYICQIINVTIYVCLNNSKLSIFNNAILRPPVFIVLITELLVSMMKK